MRSCLIILANVAWFISIVKRAMQWRLAVKKIETVQKRLLLKIIQRNGGTAFGKKHGFDSITTIDTYQQHVPLQSYSDFEPYITRVANGEGNVLSAETISLLEPTSGSAGGRKLIPYTLSLQDQFRTGIDPWIFRLYLQYPKLLLGRSYWSITPAMEERQWSQGGVPIGFASDAEYLSGLQRRVAEILMVVPPEVTQIRDIDTFRYVVVLFLLIARDLSLISVWHPSFLLLLLDNLREQHPCLIEDVCRGKVSIAGLSDALRHKLEEYLMPDTERAKELTFLFAAWDGKSITTPDNHGHTLYERIWPNLLTISAWGDGQAHSYFVELSHAFPNVVCEPKGLIATEGFISFPMGPTQGAALSILSHFFEFEEVCSCQDDARSTFLAHGLETGKRYTVVITTGGGFYRYRLGDIVEVVGYYKECPLIKFVGRADAVVDLYGEKLDELHVQEVVASVLRSHRVKTEFWMVAPEKRSDETVGYTLFLQSTHNVPCDRVLDIMVQEIDCLLKSNFHYSYCRKLGQLSGIKMFLIDPKMDAAQQYLRACQAQGQRLGAIKPRALHPFMEWSTVFEGNFLSR